MTEPVAEDGMPRSMARFWVVFGGQAFSLFGSRLVQFTLVWWLTQESGSASVLALASIMALLPQVIVGPFAGSLVDRWSRRMVLIVSDGMIALAIVLLALLYSWGVVEIWHVYALMLLRSLLGAFQWPAFQASTSMMVPKEQLSRVAGFNQSLQGLVSILAPPLGALLFEVLPISDAIRMMILKGAGTSEVRKQAIEDGMVPLMKDGMLKVQQGVTTPSEVLRNTYFIE